MFQCAERRTNGDRTQNSIARFYCLAVQRRSANDERPRTIGQTARPFTGRCRLKDARVVFRARDLVEDGTERASNNISGLSPRETDRPARGKVKPASLQIECHFSISRTLVASSSVENGFCRK